MVLYFWSFALRSFPPTLPLGIVFRNGVLDRTEKFGPGLVGFDHVFFLSIL